MTQAEEDALVGKAMSWINGGAVAEREIRLAIRAAYAKGREDAESNANADVERLALETESQMACIVALRDDLAKAQAFKLEAQSREAVEAGFYRYLRNVAGQLEHDTDGPMICAGSGDLFDFLTGEECDQAIREAMDKAAAIRSGK